VTVGSESELQAAVVGDPSDVDLPLTILGSSYLANVALRAAAGEAPRRALSHLEAYLEGNRERIWENSWVRFPLARLAPFARDVLAADLKADKADPGSPDRADRGRFAFEQAGQPMVRLPVAYLVKLALAQAAGGDDVPAAVRLTARRLLAHFLSDNTSPETLSFHLVALGAGPLGGRDLARETARRFLATQLLVRYANLAFDLAGQGQEARVFYSPNPPLRQRRLNRAISDAFYRELFMSPCLSGWDRGEDKHRYMLLCHEVLSRSQLNAVAKMREAGVLLHDLVVLPETSNLSLANNGTHLSFGSRRLGALASDPASGFTASHEKALGDLAIKVAEHFLPLFVGTLSAAPHRLGFTDFHPERVLGFLPHELADTHLRMLWRRWKGKASLGALGRTLTPFGLPLLDRALARLFALRGDLVPDFRLLDYPVALLSTERSGSLDGRLGSTERTRRDLEALGVTDARMALYLPIRLRELGSAGFCGFEARQFSLFESFERDLARAAELQRLVLAFALQAIADGRVTHEHIPDRPFVESERRQFFFAAAIGLPTLYVRADTGNRFLSEVVERTERVRASRRYAGTLRVEAREFQRALLRLLRREGGELVALLGAEATLDDLEERLEHPAERGAAGRLTRGILEVAGARSALAVEAETFNLAAERYYRERLCRRQLAEAAALVAEDVAALERGAGSTDPWWREALGRIVGPRSAGALFWSLYRTLEAGHATAESVRRLLHLVLLTEAAAAGEPRRDAQEGPRPGRAWAAAEVAG
jgi:hypothetical protein